MVKVRFHSWYWGNYCLATNKEAKNLPTGFELYNEELHGWHNSEEFKLHKTPKYNEESKDKLSSILQTVVYNDKPNKDNSGFGMALSASLDNMALKNQ